MSPQVAASRTVMPRGTAASSAGGSPDAVVSVDKDKTPARGFTPAVAR